MFCSHLPILISNVYQLCPLSIKGIIDIKTQITRSYQLSVWADFDEDILEVSEVGKMYTLSSYTQIQALTGLI